MAVPKSMCLPSNLAPPASCSRAPRQGATADQLHASAFRRFRLAALILQQQWRQALGVELVLILQDVATWVQATIDKSYPGIVASGDAGPYVDPSYFLEAFTSKSGASGSDWSDTKYRHDDRGCRGYTRIASSAFTSWRNAKRHLLRAIPIVPLLRRVPMARETIREGTRQTNLLDRQQFKYAGLNQLEAAVTREILRRTVLAAGPRALAGCAHDGPYFGTTSPPSRQRLVYANGNEPDVFDPGTYASSRRCASSTRCSMV